jgi:glycosyltransferase involved in cell wall biosynthesis
MAIALGTARPRMDEESTSATSANSAALARSIAVLIPCYNESITIRQVVHDFRAAIPGAQIYVYDNNSSDNTVELASAAGAIIRSEPMQGKGNVVRRMFGDVDADLYIMVDGDGTYDASAAPRLVTTLVSGPYDMVNVVRSHTEREAYRPGHVLGNRTYPDRRRPIRHQIQDHGHDVGLQGV